jgi:hypothetical protein
MAGDSISPNGKTGSPGKHYVQWDCEMGDENKRLFKGKTEGRELLNPDTRFDRTWIFDH